MSGATSWRTQEMDVLKCLSRTPRGLMGVAEFPHDLESLAHRCRQGRCVVPADVEVAAAGGAVKGERGENQVAADRQRAAGESEVLLTVIRIGEKMKDGAVVPRVKFAQRECVSHVTGDPLDPLCLGTETQAGALQRRLRDIQYGKPIERMAEKSIDQDG